MNCIKAANSSHGSASRLSKDVKSLSPWKMLAKKQLGSTKTLQREYYIPKRREMVFSAFCLIQLLHLHNRQDLHTKFDKSQILIKTS